MVSLDEATELYGSQLWRVDAAHREFEQKRRWLLLQGSLPKFTEVKATLDAVRTRYQDWADLAARRFNALCEKENRFTPSKSRQQRELFEQVVMDKVKPNDRVAYVLLDGFRYEMARELLDRLSDGTKFDSKLQPRLSELPSVTAVGMNVLAPVADHGRLTPVLKEHGEGRKIVGFKANTFDVTNPDSRKTAVFRRIGKQKCPSYKLDEVLDIETSSLKGGLAGDGVAIMHSLDLDEIGEVGHGAVGFENILLRIAGGIRKLRDAGIQRFVITADHGFLLEPPSTDVDVSGAKSARYRFTTTAETTDDVVSVALSDLNYDAPGVYVGVPTRYRVLQRARWRTQLCARRQQSSGTCHPRSDAYVSATTRRERRTIRPERVQAASPKSTVQLHRPRASPRAAHTVVRTDKVQITLEPLGEGLTLEVTDIRPSGDTSTCFFSMDDF